MKFKTFLLSKGLSDEQARDIIGAMAKNHFYLVKEEYLDIRYQKLKHQKKMLSAECLAIQKQNEFLKQSLTKKIDLATKLHQQDCLIADLKKELATFYENQNHQQVLLRGVEEQLKVAKKFFVELSDKDKQKGNQI